MRGPVQEAVLVAEATHHEGERDRLPEDPGAEDPGGTGGPGGQSQAEKEGELAAREDDVAPHLRRAAQQPYHGLVDHQGEAGGDHAEDEEGGRDRFVRETRYAHIEGRRASQIEAGHEKARDDDDDQRRRQHGEGLGAEARQVAEQQRPQAEFTDMGEKVHHRDRGRCQPDGPWRETSRRDEPVDEAEHRARQRSGGERAGIAQQGAGGAALLGKPADRRNAPAPPPSEGEDGRQEAERHRAGAQQAGDVAFAEIEKARGHGCRQSLQHVIPLRRQPGGTDRAIGQMGLGQALGPAAGQEIAPGGA